ACTRRDETPTGTAARPERVSPSALRPPLRLCGKSAPPPPPGPAQKKPKPPPRRHNRRDMKRQIEDMVAPRLRPSPPIVHPKGEVRQGPRLLQAEDPPPPVPRRHRRVSKQGVIIEMK